MIINLDNDRKFDLENKAESYWKGEGYFYRLDNSYPDAEALKNIYGSVSDGVELKIGSITFLRRGCSSSYDFLRTLKRVKHLLGDFYAQLIQAVLRVRFFELDLMQKLSDDLYFSRGLAHFLVVLLEEEKSLFDISFNIDEESRKRVPIRSTSETLFYLYCLNNLFKRLSMLERKPCSTEIRLETTGACLITKVISEYSDVSSLINYTDAEDSSSEILKHEFNSPSSENFGYYLEGSTFVQWYAWNN